MQTTLDYFYAECMKGLRRQFDHIKEGMAVGSVQNYDEYNRKVGQVQGLKMAQDELEEVKRLADDQGRMN